MRLAIAALLCLVAAAAGAAAAPPRYAHVVIVVEENKDFAQIVGSPRAPYLNRLARGGVALTRMFAEEHPSEGNYFWLFAGSHLGVGFHDKVPARKFEAPNLGAALLAKRLSFAGYAQGLPAAGSDAAFAPPGCLWWCRYARKHVPWASFANLPPTANRPFSDFPADYDKLPTVAFVIPDLLDDMHSGSIARGDRWLAAHIGGYVRWAQGHDSLLVVTWDENNDRSGYRGLTDPAVPPGAPGGHDRRNRIPTILYGAHLQRGYQDAMPLDHVSLLRTIEAMYGLARSGAQQRYALRAGIPDNRILREVFAR